ncbi:MAG TPA: hypothetical protein P5083_01520 [Candidatus Paceibacterota bacterium]|nr:hypothetical protein [Candidatus Paceibacterota bacterium]
MTEKIKKFLNLINQWKVILIILLIIFGLFYWFQIRPSKIYSECGELAAHDALDMMDQQNSLVSQFMEYDNFYDSFYKLCLRVKGINK